jgi:hypothetical protein
VGSSWLGPLISLSLDIVEFLINMSTAAKYGSTSTYEYVSEPILAWTSNFTGVTIEPLVVLDPLIWDILHNFDPFQSSLKRA